MYNLDIPRRLLLTGGRSTALAMPTAATDCLCSHQRALRRHRSFALAYQENKRQRTCISYGLGCCSIFLCPRATLFSYFIWKETFIINIDFVD